MEFNEIKIVMAIRLHGIKLEKCVLKSPEFFPNIAKSSYAFIYPNHKFKTCNTLKFFMSCYFMPVVIVEGRQG
jgi:hypothetical protein